MSRTSKSGKQGVMDGLTTLTRQLEQVKAQARALGIFTDDRELLECPNCELLEDVTAKGLLVTYPKDSVDPSACASVRWTKPVLHVRSAGPGSRR